ncbi:Amidinotransferase family protein [Coccidioides posadasii C735 delta SOWgp]|uniref:Glycine amidinotransferase, mitochondrial n=1 Tax=Coccidioides posadasii (strain C735) TaxID=222929 RepID=C5P7J7_COCP7|nr:Amidinotransferase family protein [Coccidioides posadasii C735 delta SOWgp]EER27397.1 Amidinotransferase family protein [Coccidioides posadasii C735 delta SOWgp]|eukprot:XP_003069542.1 Amidinotransferase family protein [Coccidioides posadasii C735 delta SOWgp]
MPSAKLAMVSADDEWSPLESVIVGRAEHSAFPSEPAHMIEATMPDEHQQSFKPSNPFPPEILQKAQEELDNFASILEREGIRVYRPKEVNWLKIGGYTGAMPRDSLMTVGNTVIEAPFAWGCRKQEVELGYSDILSALAEDGLSKVVRAPKILGRETLYDGVENCSSNGTHTWAINNTRPSFDTADFMRFGKVIIGQLSNVTNMKGVEYLRSVIPEGYTVEILQTDDPHAMHIDATILPLRNKLMVYHPERVTEKALRQHAVFENWELYAYPFTPEQKDGPPLYMTSPWLVLNALSLDENRIMVEAKDTVFASWVKEKFGMEPIMCPFQHVNSIGGSFHCATVDLVRRN